MTKGAKNLPNILQVTSMFHTESFISIHTLATRRSQRTSHW